MAENEDFKRLMEKEFAPGAGSPTPDPAHTAPKLSKADAAGELLSQVHKDPTNGIVEYKDGQGWFTYRGTSQGFTLRENQGQVHMSLDPIPDGLSRGQLGNYQNLINKLHQTLGRPEVNINFVNQLSGKTYGHQIPIPESTVLKLSENLQANEHQVNQIIKAFATGDQRAVQQTLQVQQAEKAAATPAAKAELDALLERPFRPSENATFSDDDGKKAFQELLHAPAGKPQAGHADVKVLAATAGIMGIVSTGAKAAFTHLAPAGIESALQAERVDKILNQADVKLNSGRLTPEQHKIIKEYTQEHAIAVSALSLVPDPIGATTDVAANAGDKKLVESLKAAGLPEEQANQYRLGSLSESLQEGKHLFEGYISNIKAVNEEMSSQGKVSLSVALHIKPEQLRELGELSKTLGDNPLQKRISDHPDFKSLAHLPPEQIGQLARLSAAGIDPKVQVLDGEISTISQRPAQLSPDPKLAFTEAATYIFQSGDHKYRAPTTSSAELQATVAGFGKLYGDLTKDNGLSKQDMIVLANTIRTFDQGFDHPQRLQGVISNHTGAQQVSQLSQQPTQENEIQLTH